MAVEIITKDDLEKIRDEIIIEVQKIVSKQSYGPKRLLKAREVMDLLGVSPGTLQNLRINGTLPFSKIGGVTYYIYEDIIRIIEKKKQNGFSVENTK